MNYPEVIEYSYNGDKFRAEYTFDEFYDVYIWSKNENVGPFVKGQEIDLGWWIMYYHHSYEGIMGMINEQKGDNMNDFDYVPKMIKEMENHPLHASRQKEKPMNNIDKAKQAVEAAQKQLEEAVKALEQAEKKASKIGLKIPKFGDPYYTGHDGNGAYRSHNDDSRYLSTFASTNKAQQSAFQEALCVMAEMRMQDGIVVPGNSHSLYTISYDSKWCCLRAYNWACSVGMSLFPTFESEDAAQAAINTVGEERIINCIKTMMFMTPESRGEV